MSNYKYFCKNNKNNNEGWKQKLLNVPLLLAVAAVAITIMFKIGDLAIASGDSRLLIFSSPNGADVVVNKKTDQDSFFVRIVNGQKKNN